MTFYSQQVSRLNQALYPDDDQLAHIIKAKNFIDTNYEHAIYLHQVAVEAHCSKFHFIRLFKKILWSHTTPISYRKTNIKSKAIIAIW